MLTNPLVHTIADGLEVVRPVGTRRASPALPTGIRVCGLSVLRVRSNPATPVIGSLKAEGDVAISSVSLWGYQLDPHSTLKQESPKIRSQVIVSRNIPLRWPPQP